PSALPSAIYTLSLHDALPICLLVRRMGHGPPNVRVLSVQRRVQLLVEHLGLELPVIGPPFDGQRHFKCHRPFSDWARAKPASRKDRKSTRLNSSHLVISYAVF